VVVRNATPVGDAELGAALGSLVQAKQPSNTKNWIVGGWNKSEEWGLLTGHHRGHQLAVDHPAGYNLLLSGNTELVGTPALDAGEAYRLLIGPDAVLPYRGNALVAHGDDPIGRYQPGDPESRVRREKAPAGTQNPA
jgi:hypothetical protein